MNDMENVTFIFKKRKMNVESNIEYFAKSISTIFLSLKKNIQPILLKKKNQILYFCYVLKYSVKYLNVRCIWKIIQKSKVLVN